MNLNGPRAALAATLALAVGVGAGCGSGTPTTRIKDAAFIAKCTGQTKKELTGAAKAVITEDQLRQACVCTQKKLVSQGYGDKDVKTADVGETGTRDATDCARQVLVGK